MQGARFLEKAKAHRVDRTRRLLLRLASTDLLSVILRDDTLIHSADFSGGSYTACLVQTQIVKLVKHKKVEPHVYIVKIINMHDLFLKSLFIVL